MYIKAVNIFYIEKNKMKSFSFLSFLLFSLLTSNVFPQESKIRLNHYTIEQGLSQSSVNCIEQDSLGFIWIGTQDGLNRFDGYNFTIYRPIPGNPNSISDNSILCIHAGGSGSLWVGTENGGLNKLSYLTNTFTAYEHNSNDKFSISSNCVNSISEDAKGNLWIGTNNGLDYFDKGRSKFICFEHQSNIAGSLLSDTVYSTYIDQRGRLWIGTKKGLDLFEPKRKEFIHFVQSEYFSPNNPKELNNITGDKLGYIWIATSKGLDKFNIRTKSFTNFKFSSSNPNSISSNMVNEVYVDNQGVVWIVTDRSGINYYDPKTNCFVRLENRIINSDYTFNDSNMSLIKDKEGLMWIGSFNSGIYNYDRKSGLFNLIKAGYKSAKNIENNSLSAICLDNQKNLWEGTFSSGINKLDKKSGKFIHYIHSHSPESISSDIINCIFKDTKGTIWIGTLKGLDKYDEATNSFKHFFHNAKNANSPGGNEPITITEDKSGNLWIGYSGGGLDKFNILSKTFTHFKHDPGNPNSLSNNDIENLFFDKSGILWIGTNGSGLDSYNIKTGSFKHYFHNKNNPHSISHNIVFNTYQLPDGSNDNLWIGTGGGGLDLLNISTGKIKVYTESDGLANNEIYGILGDKKGNLWISTNSGISKFDVKLQIFHNYNISDGLQSDEFNQGAYYEDDYGKLYFGGIEGLNVYDPDSITDNTFNPKIVFTSLKIYKNGFKAEQSIVMTRDITLPYNKNIISFRFAALSYSDPNKNQFSYKLKGLNKDWINIGTSNSLTFSSLSPGNYTLFVKGTNNDGLWSKNIAKIKIIITPPLWATWWFRGIIIVIMVALFISIFWYRLNSVRLKNKRLEVLVAERTKELLAKKQELEEVNNKQAELLKLLTKSEEELRGLNANKDKIMSILAHDLRSPFTGLLGYSFMLANEYDQLSPAEIKNNALNIYTISNDFFKLLNNLLE